MYASVFYMNTFFFDNCLILCYINDIMFCRKRWRCMMDTLIYFIRHGQSLGNLSQIMLGHTDLDLSPLGYLQAEKTCEELSGVHFDAIIPINIFSINIFSIFCFFKANTFIRSKFCIIWVPRSIFQRYTF